MDKDFSSNPSLTLCSLPRTTLIISFYQKYKKNRNSEEIYPSIRYVWPLQLILLNITMNNNARAPASAPVIAYNIYS